MHICVKGLSSDDCWNSKTPGKLKNNFLCAVFSLHSHNHSGTNKKYIIKVNNAKIFWALLMSLICCIPAGIPHISFLKQPEELRREVCGGAPHFAYQQSSCWQMLDLIKTAAPRQEREGSPPGQDQSRDNLPGNEKSTIVCRKYQNHHNHLSQRDLYLRSSSPWMSAATFQTELVPSTWFQTRSPLWVGCCHLVLIPASELKHRASYSHIWRKFKSGHCWEFLYINQDMQHWLIWSLGYFLVAS